MFFKNYNFTRGNGNDFYVIINADIGNVGIHIRILPSGF